MPAVSQVSCTFSVACHPECLPSWKWIQFPPDLLGGAVGRDAPLHLLHPPLLAGGCHKLPHNMISNNHDKGNDNVKIYSNHFK